LDNSGETRKKCVSIRPEVTVQYRARCQSPSRWRKAH
jgi:hypothetical protein